MQHLTTITLAIKAATQADAHQIGVSAAQHLLETFNDDGSLALASVPDAPPGDSILLPFSLSDQACYDLMCTASEGGIQYWADVIKWQTSMREGQTVPDIISFEADVQDGPVQCDHPDIEAAEIGRFTIDAPMIRAGLRRLLAPGALVNSAIRNDAVLQLIDPEHGADADTADSIVQFAVFGELVFG